MKKFLLASTVLAVSAPAFAADLPRRSAPPAPRALPILATWTGFYVGLHAGYNWNDRRNVNFIGDPGAQLGPDRKSGGTSNNRCR